MEHAEALGVLVQFGPVPEDAVLDLEIGTEGVDGGGGARGENSTGEGGVLPAATILHFISIHI